MSAFNVNYKKLVMLLLPTFLRKNALMDFIYSAVSPVAALHQQFQTFMAETKYRLSHNGQHCHLRGMLNDTFDPTQRRITLADVEGTKEPFLLYWRSENKSKRIYRRDKNKELILNRRGFGGTDGFDFVINIPGALSLNNDDITRLKALTDAYKLVSKRYQIIYV